MIRSGDMIEDDNNGDMLRRWHLGREIPIAVIVLLAIQTGGGIWWASSLANDNRQALNEIKEIKSDLKADRTERYTREDARRDREILSMKDDEFARRIQSIEQQRAKP